MTLVELVAVMAIIVIISAIALPNFVQMLRISQLNNGATQMAGILKQTRFQAIRGNTAMTCRTAQAGSVITLWADANGNGVLDAGESATVFGGNVAPTSAANVPGTASLATSVGTGITLSAVSPSTGTYTFDARGAVSPAAVYVTYIANTGMPSLGYRAIVLLPSGSIQIWNGDSAGNWRLAE